MEVVKIRIDDLTKRAKHGLAANENTGAIADNRDAVVHDDTIIDLNERILAPRFEINVAAEKIRRWIEPKLDGAFEPDRALSQHLNRLPDGRLAFNARAVR